MHCRPDNGLLQRVAPDRVATDGRLRRWQRAVQGGQVHANIGALPVLLRTGHDVHRQVPGHMSSAAEFHSSQHQAEQVDDWRRLGHFVVVLLAAIVHLQLHPAGQRDQLRVLGNLSREYNNVFRFNMFLLYRSHAKPL